MIDFDESTHTYKIDGRPVPGVTQILGAMNCVDTRWYTEEGRERGKAIDTLTELYDRGELDLAAVEKICPQYLGYVAAWIAFRKMTSFVPVRAQVKVANAALGYAGMMDRDGNFCGRMLTILDIKSGAREWWHPLQTQAYAQCVCGTERCERGCVYLGRDGRYKWDAHTDDGADRSAWTSLVNVFNYRKNKGASKDD